MLDRIR